MAVKRSILVALVFGATGVLTSACSGVSTSEITRTATVTVTSKPAPAPIPQEDPESALGDGEFIVNALCRIATAYEEFDSAAASVVTNPELFPRARELAGSVVFAIRALPSILSIGPEGGWKDPWLGLAAFQVADAVDAYLPTFESAEKSRNAGEMQGLYFGVLSAPIDQRTVEPLLAILPPQVASDLILCARI